MARRICPEGFSRYQATPARFPLTFSNWRLSPGLKSPVLTDFGCVWQLAKTGIPAGRVISTLPVPVLTGSQ
jgi:hypothetical protein